MADVKKYTNQIAKAQKGRDVRDAIVNAINEVSDENNEYNQVKADILSAQSDIAKKVTKNEQTEQTFAADVKKAEELKQGLDTDITQGTALKSQLDAAVEAADTSRKNLDASNTTAEQTKTALDGSVSNAQTLKQSLDSDITQGTTLKTDLESDITQGTALKSQLDNTVKTADTSRKNLNASVETAGTIKESLESSTETAKSTKTALDNSNTVAAQTKTALDNSNDTAGATKTALDESISNAGTSKQELDSDINQGNTLKTQLETTISTADTSKKDLDASNTAAGKTKTALDTSNTTATKTKADLDVSNTTASETKTGLDETNKTAASLVTSLGDKITEGTQVKNDIQTTGETATNNLQTEAAKQQEYIKTSIDDTLLISGKAADAAVTGKKIDSLKENLSNKITKFYASNQGETHLQDSDNGKIMDMMIYGKTSQDGAPTPENPVEIKNVVNPKVEVLNENGTESQIVTIPYTLKAVPTSSGGNVTIGEQQYVSDYVDVEKGKLYRKVKQLNLKDVDTTKITHGFHSNGNGYLLVGVENISREHQPISNQYKGSKWTDKSGYLYIPSSNSIVFVDDRFTDKQTAIKLIQDTYAIYALSSQIEEDLSLEQIKFLKSLSTNYPVTNITVGSEELDGYVVFNYPVSMANGWNYVKQQLNDNRDYIYDMDLQSAEAYVNSEYAVVLTELEV